MTVAEEDLIDRISKDMGKYVDHYILKDKKVVKASFKDWSEFFNSPGKRIVKQEDIGEYFVSTVFIGLHDQLFETMIFGGKYDDYEYQVRVDTWEEAEEEHKKAIEKVRSTDDSNRTEDQ